MILHKLNQYVWIARIFPSGVALCRMVSYQKKANFVLCVPSLSYISLGQLSYQKSLKYLSLIVVPGGQCVSEGSRQMWTRVAGSAVQCSTVQSPTVPDTVQCSALQYRTV